MELALHIYSTSNRAIFSPVTFRLELDACLRWCSLLWEQNDLEVNRNVFLSYLNLFFRNTKKILNNISPE
jgi:hypothetical protein